MTTRIKICGLTNRADALHAADAGADALGFVLAPNRRRSVTADEVRAIVRELTPLIATVGLFIDASADEIERTAHRLGLSAVQLHGAESADLCAELARRGLRVIKAIAVGPTFAPSEVELYRAAGAAILLDSPGGGSGHRFDRTALVGLRGPFTLAGGLKPKTVADAVRALRPAAVDVSSGVERALRTKDPTKVAAFIRAVRDVDREAV